MSTEEERQAFDLAEAIEALKPYYPGIPPELDEKMRNLIEELRIARVGRLAGQAMAVIGQTHQSIRKHQDVTDIHVARVEAHQIVADSRVAGVQEDMVGMQAEQDLAAESIAAITEGLAALVEVHTAKRLAKLEQWKDDISSAVRGIEDEVAHLLRAGEQGQGEATAPHTD